MLVVVTGGTGLIGADAVIDVAAQQRLKLICQAAIPSSIVRAQS